MKKILLFLLCVLFVSCGKEDLGMRDDLWSPNNMTVPAFAGSYYFTHEIDRKVDLLSVSEKKKIGITIEDFYFDKVDQNTYKNEWCTVNVEDNKVHVTISQNDSSESRRISILMYEGYLYGLSLIQEGADN